MMEKMPHSETTITTAQKSGELRRVRYAAALPIQPRRQQFCPGCAALWVQRGLFIEAVVLSEDLVGVLPFGLFALGRRSLLRGLPGSRSGSSAG